MALMRRRETASSRDSFQTWRASNRVGARRARDSRWKMWDLSGWEEREREKRRKESGRVVRAKMEMKVSLFLRKILRESSRVLRAVDC